MHPLNKVHQALHGLQITLLNQIKLHSVKICVGNISTSHSLIWTLSSKRLMFSSPYGLSTSFLVIAFLYSSNVIWCRWYCGECINKTFLLPCDLNKKNSYQHSSVSLQFRSQLPFFYRDKKKRWKRSRYILNFHLYFLSLFWNSKVQAVTFFSTKQMKTKGNKYNASFTLLFHCLLFLLASTSLCLLHPCE